MSDVFFNEMKIPRPYYRLQNSGSTHAQMTGRMMEGIENALLEWKPDLVLVYGDTNSTLAGAIAAAKMQIDIAHIEAGLRSFNRNMPEEINRILTDHISKHLFAPTSGAVDQLAREGIVDRVYNVGDVMYDAAICFGEIANSRKAKGESVVEVPSGPYILATIHRAENTDDLERLRVIFGALAKVSMQCNVICPIHPRTRKALSAIDFDFASSKVEFIDPVGYLDMIMLESNSSLIVTDSGGVQKEAYFHKVPCVVLRDQTEWVELISAGWNILCSALDQEEIVTSIITSIGRKGKEISPYGSGNASQIIAEHLSRL